MVPECNGHDPCIVELELMTLAIDDLAELLGSAELSSVLEESKERQSEDINSEGGLRSHEPRRSDRFCLEPVFQNHKWSSFKGIIPAPFKIDLCYPASSFDIKKRQPQNYICVLETAMLYNNISKPFFNSHPLSESHWIRNILDGLSETESIILQSPDPLLGYVLLPDSKWDRVSLESIYLLCITRHPSLLTIRDLRGSHLPLLRLLKTQITFALQDSYGISWNQVKVFFHYLPTFYHLHLHITSVSLQSATLQIGKAHFLDDVIQNLESNHEYYIDRNIPMVIGSLHPLFSAFSEIIN